MYQKGFSSILILIAGILVGGVIVGAYFLGGMNSSKLNQTQSSPTFNPQATKEAKSSPSPIAIDPTPKNFVIYHSKLKDADILFLTHLQAQKYYDSNGKEQTSPNKGYLMSSIEGSVYNLTYQDLENPRRIFTDPNNNLSAVYSFAISSDRKYIYVSAIHGLSIESEVNKVYKIDLNNLDAEELWIKDYNFKPLKYPGFGGMAGINLITGTDKYIVLQIGVCYHCGGGWVPGALILNVETKKEEFIGPASNFSFDANKKIISFQKMNPFKEKCKEMGGMGCDENNEMIVYKPSGPTLSLETF